MIRTICALSLVLLPCGRARGEEFTFENDAVRLILGDDGAAKGLVEKATGRDWLVSKSYRFAWIKKGGKFFSSTAVARQGESLRLSFDDSGVTADYRLTIRPRYFVIELAAIQGEGVEDVCLGQLQPSITENIGGWLDVRWNEQFAVCFMALSPRVNTGGSRAIVYSQFGTTGEKAAIIAVPKTQLLDVIQQVQRDCGLPRPTLSGHWAKTSPDVRRGYLFIDLTEANAEETIRYAKLGHFGYVMTYDGTWASSLGSYPINLRNFPRGEESLKGTVDRCHAAGLKVGLHTLTSFVGKNDPLVRPKPDRRLLKDAEAVLAADIDAATKDIPAATALDGFPGEAAYYGASKQGFDLVIDDEIIRYGQIGSPDGKTFLRCIRGWLGTTAAEHKAGAKIYHLCERYGCYLVDLRTSLKDELAERIAGVINRCGFDMIYFDGGECNAANGPYWYWVSPQQMAVYQRVKRDLLVQGSGGTPWTWHIFARGCCDDFAAVAPKQYLDYHKIADSWEHYTKSFMPAELGWWGFLDDQPHHPATSPDEVEYYAVRMLALDSPVSLETHLSALKKNGRTEELLQLLGEYERLRLSGAMPPQIRRQLRQGEWHMTKIGGKPVFQPIRYDVHRVVAPGQLTVTNRFGAQPLKFRLQAVPTLASPGEKANVVLIESDPPAELPLPQASAPMPGTLVGSVELTKPAGQQARGLPLGPKARVAGGEGKPINLIKHRALAVKLRVDSPAPAAGEPCPVLNVQLEAGAQTYRDHYVDLGFTGERTWIIPEPTTERMLPEFRPQHANYEFKSAMYGFNYQGIVAVNFRWMRLPKDKPVRCAVALVEALAESPTVLKGPELALGEARLALPAELNTGDCAEFWADGQVRIFDRNGVLLKTVTPTAPSPPLAAGENQLRITAAGPAPAKLTVITLGEPLRP